VQVALDLASTATAGTVTLAAAQAGHLGMTAAPAAITVLIGGLQAE
jgi:hypothetical protein